MKDRPLIQSTKTFIAAVFLLGPCFFWPIVFLGGGWAGLVGFWGGVGAGEVGPKGALRPLPSCTATRKATVPHASVIPRCLECPHPRRRDRTSPPSPCASTRRCTSVRCPRVAGQRSHPHAGWLGGGEGRLGGGSPDQQLAASQPAVQDPPSKGSRPPVIQNMQR